MATARAVAFSLGSASGSAPGEEARKAPNQPGTLSCQRAFDRAPPVRRMKFPIVRLRKAASCSFHPAPAACPQRLGMVTTVTRGIQRLSSTMSAFVN